MSYASLNTLQLYRHILKAAKQFPSVKKNAIIREIKSEFRAHQTVNDEGKLIHCRQVAERGLSDLESYIGSNQGGTFDLYLKGQTT